MINELFLINDDTLNIFKSEFIKIEKLLNINNEKNLISMFIDVIKTDKINENDEKNSFIRTFETDEDKTDKVNQRQEYLSSSISFLSALSFFST